MARQLVPNISTGNIAKLKSQDYPLMAISSYDRKTKEATCIWFEDDIKTATYNINELDIISEEIDYNSDNVAQWMRFTFERNGMLSQKYAVAEISKIFDKGFLTRTGSGNSINPTVLSTFKRLSSVNWDFNKQMWFRKK